MSKSKECIIINEKIKKTELEQDNIKRNLKRIDEARKENSILFKKADNVLSSISNNWKKGDIKRKADSTYSVCRQNARKVDNELENEYQELKKKRNILADKRENLYREKKSINLNEVEK